LPLATTSINLVIDSDRAAMESVLASDLATLASHATAQEQKTLSDAAAELTAIHAAAPAAADVGALIDRVMNLINDLGAVSLDTTTARADADRILVYWQSRAN
jgi:hypothetical protein